MDGPEDPVLSESQTGHTQRVTQRQETCRGRQWLTWVWGLGGDRGQLAETGFLFCVMECSRQDRVMVT